MPRILTRTLSTWIAVYYVYRESRLNGVWPKRRKWRRRLKFIKRAIEPATAQQEDYHPTVLRRALSSDAKMELSIRDSILGRSVPGAALTRRRVNGCDNNCRFRLLQLSSVRCPPVYEISSPLPFAVRKNQNSHQTRFHSVERSLHP